MDTTQLAPRTVRAAYVAAPEPDVPLLTWTRTLRNNQRLVVRFVSVMERIELFYWEGCPSHPEAKELLQQVLAERRMEVEVELREVRTQQEAEVLRFPGSPTIRIDDRDIDPAGAAAPPALTCRIYRLPDGRVSPIPSREQLEEALR